MRRGIGPLVAAGLAGMLAGAVLTLSLQGGAFPLDPAPPLPSPVPRTPEPPGAILAWTPGRLPDGFAAALEGLPDVEHAVVVSSGTAWLTESRTADDAVADRPLDGLAVPLELAAVDPPAYAAFLPPADRGVVAALAAGEVVLGSSSAALRGLSPGAALRFGSVTARVAAVLPDELVGAHEVLGSRSLAAGLGIDRPRYALIDPTAGIGRPELTPLVRGLLPSGTPLRLRAPGETPYFRHGDAVLPPVKLKELFGEFAARPEGSSGAIAVNAGWERRYIVTADVPVVGRVTCNRVLMPQLRGALEELERRQLSHLIDPSDFGGCYAPRFLGRDPGAGLSHHAWGAAVDLNVSTNPLGRVPTMDPRVVEVFERWGFVWGGRWLVPDGMHFDVIRLGGTP